MRKMGLIVALAAAMIATTTTASAHEFVANKTGTTGGNGVGTQTFELGGSTIECADASTSTDVMSLQSESLPTTVEYSKCTLLGELEVEVSSADFSLDASGAASILKTITMKIPAAGCTVTIPEQSGLEEASYENDTTEGSLIAKLSLTGLSWSGEGESCPVSGSEGKYHGELSVDGVSWR